MGKHVWRDNDPLLYPGGRRPAKRRWRFWLTLLLIFVLFAVGSGYYTYWKNYKNLQKPEVAEAEPALTVLVLGVDKRTDDVGRSDTVMVVNLVPQYKVVRVISLPRDTRVQIPGYDSYYRLNSAYGFGGPELVQKTIEKLLGLKIDYFITTDFQGFANIIDTIGGVEINVEKPMYYDDYAQDLHIKLDPGLQKLSGDDALAYVRFRNDGLGDVSLVDPINIVYEGRIQRQQKFLKAVAEQVVDLENLWKAPLVMKRLADAVETNMPVTTMLRYTAVAGQIPANNVITTVLPGEGGMINGVAYWVPDEGQISRLVQTLQRPTPPPTIAEGEEVRPIKIKILNGSGMQGVARQASSILNQQGFETFGLGNAPNFNYQETEVILHSPVLDAVSQIRETLRVYGQVKEDYAVEDEVDVTIILGKDYNIKK